MKARASEKFNKLLSYWNFELLVVMQKFCTKVEILQFFHMTTKTAAFSKLLLKVREVPAFTIPKQVLELYNSTWKLVIYHDIMCANSQLHS